jgi:tripartite ATP-independent transporter DctM subunit
MFKAWFGWLPGGLIFVAVVVSAFFTTFTGASGVTILALGLLLFQILTKSGYSPAFAMGLLTASGSIGILFPPSLPMILYGSQARLSVIDMFLAGFVPGIMMVLAMTALGVFSAFKTKVERVPFHLNVALISLKDAFFDLMLPLLIIGVYFTGWMSLTETAAMAVVYVLVFQVLLLRDLRGADLHRAIIKALVIMGGILMILAMARGLSYFIIDTQMPQMLATWVKQSISSPFLFLLLLNVVLLIVGSIMEIYASILVVVPLLLPLGVVYGIDPIHLGIIFLVNMEIGFLLPPVGLNLYLASFVFKKPLGEMTRDILPFLAIQLVILLLVTYIPWFSIWLPSVVKFVP